MGGDEQSQPGRDGRDETELQRLDRHWSELLQELRVAQTGVQVLTGFLLTVAFQPRFDQLDDLQRHTYLLALLAAVASTVLLLAPVSIHRALYRRHRREALVDAGDRLAKAGLACLAVATSASVLLIADVTFGGSLAWVVAAGIVTSFVAGWLALPLVMRRRR